MKYYPANKTKVKACSPHGVNDVLPYGFIYKPDVWTANTVYTEKNDLVIPTVFSGFYHKLNSNGKSGATEPTWATVKDGLTTDGTAEFKAVHYDLFLDESETLAATSDTWAATNGVTLTNKTYTSTGKTSVMAGPIPAGVTSYELTNTVVDNNGRIDEKIVEITVK